jgi:RND family efflux transporter MFP subunit
MGGKKRARRAGPWIGWGLVAAGAIGGGIWYQRKLQEDAAKLPRGVQTARVDRGDIDQKITASGVAAAQVGAKVNIGSQITGRIRSLPADVGTLVRAGQVVAILDSPDLEAQVEQQKQSTQVAAANLEQAESRLRQALLTADLSKEQTTAQINESESALRGAEARLRAASSMKELQPAQTTAEIARAEAALSTARSQEHQVRETVAQQILQAQSSVDDARVSVENATRLLRRQQRLYAQGYLARQEVDDTRTRCVQVTAQLKSAEAALRISRERTEADLATARNRVAEAEANLRVSKAGRLQDAMRAEEERSAEDARRQARATLELRKSNRTQDLIRRRGVEEARSSVAQARASLQQARALLRFQQAQLDKAVIRSPITGTVLSITAQQGETVAAGFSAPTLITVADLNRLEVRAYVDEVDVGKARLALPAEVRVETFPNRIFRGRVTKIAAASTVKDNVVTYETTVAMTDGAGLMRPDMTADVTLILGRTPGVLRIPTESIHREVRRSVVYVLHREKQAKERVEERTVVTGVRDNTHIEIRSGLKEGDEVILAGLERLGVVAVDSQKRTGEQEQK